MSRTALIHLIRRAYKVCRLSATTDIPVSEVQGFLSEQVSRRQVLGGMAIAGTMGITPKLGNRVSTPLEQHSPVPPVPESPAAADAKVLIVGAGIAGLTAAYRLRQAGVSVDVVEASRRVGGRLLSLSQIVNSPGVVEMGGEFIDSRHIHVRSLATELGLELADLRAADADLEPEILFFQGQKISHSQVIAEFIPLAQRISQDLKTLGDRDITYHAPSPNAVRLDRLSLAEYLASTPISPVIDQLVRVAYVTEFGRDAEDQSCLNMLFLIGADAGQWSTYGVSDERYHVIGGNDQIPKRLAVQLEGVIETSTVLESIRRTAGDRYQVSLRSGSSSSDRIYERILLTLPFTVLRQVELAVEMPPVKQRAIAQLGYGTSSKLAIPYQERIWRSQYGCTISVYTDMDFQNTWESVRYAPGPGGWVTDLRGGKQGIDLGSNSPEHQAEELTQNLNQIFPGLSQVGRGQAVRSIWATQPYALGSYACYLPEQWTTIGGAEIERVGNIWFAGEHCSLGSQGYMNGACETAEQAAQSILADLKLNPKQAVSAA